MGFTGQNVKIPFKRLYDKISPQQFPWLTTIQILMILAFNLWPLLLIFFCSGSVCVLARWSNISGTDQVNS